MRYDTLTSAGHSLHVFDHAAYVGDVASGTCQRVVHLGLSVSNDM